MTDFAFQIVGDASRAEQAISSVERRLDAIGASAVAVNLKLRDALGGGNDSLARAALAARRATGEQNDQLKRQADLLSRIHGPAKSLASDLQALDALYRRGTVSLSEYADEYRRLQSDFARSRPGAAPAAPTSSGLGLGSLRGAATAIGVGVGVREVGELADTYQNLQNRLRFLAGGDMAKVNALFAQTRQVAAATRSDLESTTEAFVRLSLATKQMGISQTETLQLTQRINEAIKLSGATSAEAAAGMIQLSQGLASGALRGDELRSVMEQLPAVADVIASSLGVTRGQLRQMGAEGKITADVIVEAFRKAGPELDKAFGNTVPTISESLVQLKNDAVVAFGSFAENSGIATAFGGALHVVGDALSAVTGFFEILNGALNGLGPVLTGSIAAFAAWRAGMLASLGPIGAVVAGLEAAKFIGDKLSETFNADLRASIRMNTQLAAAYEGFTQQTAAVIKDLDALHQEILAHRDLADALGATGRALVDGSANFETFTDLLSTGGAVLARLTSDLDAGQAALAENNKAYAEAHDNVEKLAGSIAILQTRMQQLRDAGVANPLAILSAGDVATIRAYQDAQEDAADLTGRYGAVVNEIHKRERERRRGIDDLKGALDAGTITQEQFNEAIKRYIPNAARAVKETERLEAAFDRLVEERQANEARARQIDAEDFVRDVEEKLNAEEEAQDRAVQNAMDAAEAKIKAHQEWKEAVLKATDEAAERRQQFEENEKRAAEQVSEAWAQGLGSITADLVNMAAEGEVSLEKLSMALAKLAIQIAAMQIGGPWGQFLGSFGSGLALANGGQFMGVPRYDSGGQGMVGGNYGLDNNLFVARVSRDERVTIETPEDQRTGKYFGGRSAPTYNTFMFMDDPSRIVSSLGTRPGEAQLVEFDRRYRRRR